MSASNDRRKRAEARVAGTDRKTNMSAEEIKKQKKSKFNWTFGSIVVGLLIAAIIILNTNLFYTGTTAVQIGDQSYNTAQFSYYYKTQYYNFVQNYGSYASMLGLDTSSPLKKQTCSMLSDGGSWYDYFKQQALSMMEQVTAMSDYAKKNNITLTSDEEAEIDTEMQSYATSASSNKNYSTTSAYLSALFGRGCDEALVRGELERTALARKAYTTVSDSYTFTDAELEKEYQTKKDDFDTFDYTYYMVEAKQVATAASTATDTTATNTTATDTTAQTAVTAETMAEAKATADKIAAAVKSGEAAQALSFDEAVKEITGSQDNSATAQTGISGSSITGDYAEWLKDASRKAGDITVVESADTGYWVVQFNGRDDNHYQMAQVRHILIKAEASSDGTYTDEAKATAKAKAQKIYDEWLAGDKTEDSFAALAKQYSEDTGSASNGGLYDSIYKGETVEEFNNFCFASGRKTGDTGIVYGEAAASSSSDSGYAGYHIIYYVGLGDLYSSYLAKNQLVSDKISAWQTDLLKGYTATTKFPIRFASST